MSTYSQTVVRLSNLVNVPKNVQNLTLDDFNEKLKNLPVSLRNLTLGACINQKLENLPVGLQTNATEIVKNICYVFTFYFTIKKLSYIFCSCINFYIFYIITNNIFIFFIFILCITF